FSVRHSGILRVIMFDAFISYSHSADIGLASALQAALHRFAKPWYKLRAMRIFRDETSLAAASNLPRAIQAALDGSRFLLLMASPVASKSRWVGLEVDHWLSGNKPIDRTLIILTDGELVWDGNSRDYDWTRTNALPINLKGRFENECLYVDLRWVKGAQD